MISRITTAVWLAGIFLASAGAIQAQPDFLGEGNSPAISSDGRAVAFSRNINGVSQVFVNDAQVSVNSAGHAGNAASSQPAISADGRFVAFVSSANNLVTGDSNNVADIFVHDRQTGTTTRVSVNSSGGKANGASSDPAISADGRYVAFVSNASNLVAGDTNGAGDIFVYDRQTGATTRVSVGAGGVQANAASSAPSVSADGRYVAFVSLASNLVTGDTNSASDAFVRDRQAGATTRVSISSSGTQANNSSREPSLSADGRYVAFTSQASNLVTDDTNGAADVFVYDRQTAKTARVSAHPFADSDSPSISGDGRFVAFRQNPSEPEIFVHDRQTQGTNSLIPFHYPYGALPSISSDGRFVAYEDLGFSPVVIQVAAVPRIEINVSGSEVSPGRTQFTADVEPVTWSIHPAVGSITATGLYTAPASVVTPLLVTARAQSTVDTTRSGASWVGVGQKTGEIKYQDTFNSPFLYVIQEDGTGWTRWSVIDEGTNGAPSNWKSVDSILTQTSNIYGGAVDAFSPEKPGTYLLLPGGGYNPETGTLALDPYEWKNYTVTVRLRSTDDDAIGVMFGYRDANNYYRFSMDRERKYRRLVKVVNGVFNVLAQDAVAYQTGRWYNVQATMARGVIQILVDGQEVFNVHDTTHDKGTIALYTWNNTGAEFDDLGVLQNIALACTYSLEPKSVTVSAQAVTGAVQVLTQDDCPWTVTSNATWITVGEDDRSGLGGRAIHYQVATNTSPTARERTLVLDSGAALTVHQAGATSGSGLPFGDDFSAGVWPGPWTVVDEGTTNAPSHWFVQNGILNQNSNIFGGDASALPTPGTYALIGQAAWSNYKVSVKMLSTDDDGIGLMFGYKDKNNYYRFSMDRQQSYRRLVKVVNGVFTKLAEDSMAYSQSQWHTVEATMISGRIKIIFDGQTLFAVSDTSHTAGKVALYSWNNTGAQFDEFAVTAAAGTVTTCVSDAGGLHAALVKAAANGQNDVIRLVRGQYNGNFFYSPAEPLHLTILGGYSANCGARVVDPTNTVLDGMSNCAPVLQFSTTRPADLALEGLTLRNGGGFCETASAAGGLFARTSGEVTLTRSVLSHNIAADDRDNGAGGGANIGAAKVTMRDNTVEENEVGFYGGGLSIAASTVELTGNRVRANFTFDAHGSSYASGIDIHCPGFGSCAGTVTLTGNVIEQNGTYNAVDCQHNKLVIQDNIIRDNSEVTFRGSEITFVNNVVADDYVALGSNYFAANRMMHVINNTVTGNSGWGMSISADGPVNVYNNIFFNKGGDLYNAYLSVDSGSGKTKLFNNDFDRAAASVPDPIDASNLNNVDPLFVDSANGDYRLRPSSPVVNKGANAAPNLPAKDIEGNARILLGKVDMGAFEATGAVPAPATPSPANGATGVVLTPTLTWTAGLGATSHDVYFGTSANPPLVTSTTGTSYTPAALTANKKYYWKVVAKAGAKSSSSPIWSFTTGNPAPSEPLPANGATGVMRTPTLRWVQGMGASSYDVYFGLTSPPPLVTNTTGTTFSPGTLNATRKYYWKVVAKTSGGTPTSSPIWSFTTK